MRKRLIPILFLFPLSLLAQQADTIALNQIDSLLAASVTLTSEKRIDEALELNNKATKITLKHFGQQSEANGDCKFHLSKTLLAKGDYEIAEERVEEAITIYQKTLGEETDKVARAYQSLGLINWYLKNYEKTESSFIKGSTIFEKTGNEREYALATYSIGTVLLRQKKYLEAESQMLKASDLYIPIFGKESSQYISLAINLGIVNFRTGRYEESELLYEEARALIESTFGKKYRSYGSVMSGLANLHIKMGNYELAGSYANKYKDLNEELYGKEHRNYAYALNAVAMVHSGLGDHEKAELAYEEALMVVENMAREERFKGLLINNLGNLYVKLGNYQQAAVAFEESLEIFAKTSGKEDPEYARNLSNAADLQQIMGNYEKAEELFLEAIAICEKVQGQEATNYPNFLMLLAKMYINTGDYEKAAPLIDDSFKRFEKIMGKDSGASALCFMNWGEMYFKQGEFEKAESAYLDAKRIRGKAFNTDHRQYAETLAGLGKLYAAMDEPSKAVPVFLELAEMDRSASTKALNHLSERELSNYLNLLAENQNELLAFTQKHPDPEVIAACYDNALFYKGFLLNSLGQIKRIALSDSLSSEKLNRLKGVQRRLATNYALPLAERDQDLVASLEERSNRLEKDINQIVAGYEDANRQVNWKEVQAKLKDKEVAIEFVQYQYTEKGKTSSSRYAALLIEPGAKAPKFIPLFKEKELSKSLALPKYEKEESNQETILASRGVKPVKKLKQSIYELLWKPLETELENVETIYFAPSGLLHRINLAAVLINKKEYLADRYQLVRLNTMRHLVLPIQLKEAPPTAALYGGIRYDTDSLMQLPSNPESAPLLAARGALDFSKTETNNRGESWNYLEWTAREINVIDSVLENKKYEVTKRKGYTASEEFFHTIGRNSLSPRILHLATHGFLFPKS